MSTKQKKSLWRWIWDLTLASPWWCVQATLIVVNNVENLNWSAWVVFAPTIIVWGGIGLLFLLAGVLATVQRMLETPQERARRKQEEAMRVLLTRIMRNSHDNRRPASKRVR